MSSIDEMRKMFYDDDDDDYSQNLGVGTSSTGTGPSTSSSSIEPGRGARESTTGSGSASSSTRRTTTTTTYGVSSSSSSSAMTTGNSRPGPYPKRSSTGQSTSRGGTGGRSGAAKPKESFVNRAFTPDYDTDFGMDVDVGARVADADADALLARETREASDSDVVKLLREWQDERHAPEILPSSDALLARVLDAIRRQSEDASALRTAASMSEEEHYMTMLVQTEVERMKFIVRSYVRTRLFKIEQYAAHITSTPSIQKRLTAAELRHAQRYATLTVSQFRSTVLDHLPETQQGLDDEVITIPNMITEPNKDKPIFCHTFERVPALVLRNGTTQEIERDTIVMAPYRTVEQLLLRGEAELV